MNFEAAESHLWVDSARNDGLAEAAAFGFGRDVIDR